MTAYGHQATLRGLLRWLPLPHFDSLSPDIHERLAARGIDPERSAEAWLAAIRDGSWPLTGMGRRAGRRSIEKSRHHASVPGARFVPVPIPLAAAKLRPCDREILLALADGPRSAQEISDWIMAEAREEWSVQHGYDFEWGTDDEPVGARLLAHSEARKAGIKLLAHEIYSRLRVLEKRGAVERIQIEGTRPMLWSRRV